MENRVIPTLVFLLVLAKIIAATTTNFSLFGDEAQYWIWSKNFDFGYFSKPPLLSWFLGAYTYVFGDSFFSLKIFPNIFYFFTSIGVYILCKQLNIDHKLSLLCSFSFYFMPSVSVSSFLVSTDVILIFFWTISMLVFLYIRKNPSILNFILLGIMLGLALLSKYAAVYFFVCLCLVVVLDKKTRDVFSQNAYKVLVFFVVVILIVTPNILWNFNNGWITMLHTANNISLKNTNIDILRGLGFLFIQILMIGPVLFFGFLFVLKKISMDFENIFLLCFSIPVLIIVFVESVLVRANANWAAPALVSLLILFIRSFQSKELISIYLNICLNFVFGVLLFVFISVNYPHKTFDRINGVKKFSEELAAFNKADFLVVNDRLLFSVLAYELRGTKTQISMPYPPGGKITNHFQLTSNLNNKNNKNFLLIGDVESISYLLNDYNVNHIKDFDVLFTNNIVGVYEIIF
mgnify:CR=1 FL=1